MYRTVLLLTPLLFLLACQRAEVEETPWVPPTAVPTAVAEQPIAHVVQQGEYLTAIASRYDVTVAAIVEANDLSDASKIDVGQQLLIPGTSDGADWDDALYLDEIPVQARPNGASRPQPLLTPQQEAQLRLGGAVAAAIAVVLVAVYAATKVEYWTRRAVARFAPPAARAALDGLLTGLRGLQAGARAILTGSRLIARLLLAVLRRIWWVAGPAGPWIGQYAATHWPGARHRGARGARLVGRGAAMVLRLAAWAAAYARQQGRLRWRPPGIQARSAHQSVFGQLWAKTRDRGNATSSRVRSDLSEAELQRAIASGEIVVRCEPVIELGTRLMTHVHARLVWEHPTLGALTTSRFWRLVERGGLSGELTTLLLAGAPAQAQAFGRSAAGPLPVTVSLARSQFFAPSLLTAIESAQSEEAWRGRGLTISLSGRASAEELDAAAGLFRALHALGVATLLEDFGASSSEQLRQWGIDAVQIDFFGAARNDGAEAYVAEAVRVAKSAKMAVTARRVGTPAELELCERLSCDFAQGEALGEPELAAARVGEVA